MAKSTPSAYKKDEKELWVSPRHPKYSVQQKLKLTIVFIVSLTAQEDCLTTVGMPDSSGDILTFLLGIEMGALLCPYMLEDETIQSGLKKTRAADWGDVRKAHGFQLWYFYRFYFSIAPCSIVLPCVFKVMTQPVLLWGHLVFIWVSVIDFNWIPGWCNTQASRLTSTLCFSRFSRYSASDDAAFTSFPEMSCLSSPGWVEDTCPTWV